MKRIDARRGHCSLHLDYISFGESKWALGMNEASLRFCCAKLPRRAHVECAVHAACRNLNYWDSVSTLAGEVASPAKTFPRALFMAVGLVIFMYVAPLAACLGVMSEAGDWKLGFFATVAQKVGGSWLAWWMLAAAAVRSHRKNLFPRSSTVVCFLPSYLHTCKPSALQCLHSS